MKINNEKSEVILMIRDKKEVNTTADKVKLKLVEHFKHLGVTTRERMVVAVNMRFDGSSSNVNM